VRPEFRGHGVGGQLLTTLIERARTDGIDRISLSVERDNPAARLYLRHGFVPQDASDHSWTMVLRVQDS
jgi:ribosomal protein S18 acetylase RimI-like enzyme